MEISFIIPAFNEEKNIVKCLNSIFSALYNYGKSVTFEVILVDNNSTDNTKKIVAEKFPEVRIIDCPIKGVTNARQAGFKVALFEIQAYIDADNEIPMIFGSKKWLNVVENNINEKPEVAAISGPLIFESNHRLTFWSRYFYRLNQLAKIIIGPSIQGGNFVIRKSVLEKIGGHSTNILFYGEDTDLAIRASKEGKVLLVPDMRIWASPRRFEEEGYFKTTFVYALNYFSMHLLGRPWTKTYKDIRP